MLAVSNLGYMLLHGQGGEAKPAEGVKLLRFAAENGVPDAQFALGFAFENGMGVRRDLTLAYGWYAASIRAFPGKVAAALRRIEARLDPSDLAKAKIVSTRISALISERKTNPTKRSPAGNDNGVSAVQWALIWTGHYNSKVDGNLGPLTRRAVRSWQKQRGFSPVGRLDTEQTRLLFADAARVKSSMDWATYKNKSVGYQIGYPKAIFLSSKRIEYGGRRFVAKVPGHKLAVLILPLRPSTTLDGLFEAFKEIHVRHGRTVVYSAKDPDWFVITGRTTKEADAGFYYMRFDRRPSAAIGFIYIVPGDGSTIWSRATIAMFNSFKVSARPNLENKSLSSSQSTPARPGHTARGGTTDQLTLAESSAKQPLNAEQLFRKASKSVYVVMAGKKQAGKWEATGGSAVAISSSHLLTNCHVVSGADAIIIAQKDRRLFARLVSESSRNDRCVLASSAPLPVWSKVRRFADLNVGEKVYAIGAPRNLELTLSDGLISSKRTLNGRHLIQTSAPISKGSSGGGLFDRYGNLIGITTFYLRESQNLNFAIAADDFLKSEP